MGQEQTSRVGLTEIDRKEAARERCYRVIEMHKRSIAEEERVIDQLTKEIAALEAAERQRNEAELHKAMMNAGVDPVAIGREVQKTLDTMAATGTGCMMDGEFIEPAALLAADADILPPDPVETRGKITHLRSKGPRG